jgi:hypothetical protein
MWSTYLIQSVANSLRKAAPKKLVSDTIGRIRSAHIVSVASPAQVGQLEFADIGRMRR